MEAENLKEIFLETLNDLSLSIAYLKGKSILPFEIKKIANECKISTAEAYEMLEKAKREKWSWRKK
jgi:60S ribosomal protein L35|nr:MAG TPA: hypothetical protein [Caudoviricetes sp.]